MAREIIGIDLSLVSTGICALTEKDSVLKVLKSELIKPKSKGVPRLVFISDGIERMVREIEPELIALEGYSFGSRAGQAFSIGELGGIIKKLLYQLGFKTIIIPPTCLKKFITGKGNSPKEVMLMKTLSKYKREFADNNLCDAFGLAAMGAAFLNGADVKYEQEALEKVRVLV